MEHIDMMIKMMSGSLDIEEPWYIAGAEFNEAELSLHIYVEIRKGSTIACPRCGAQTKRFGMGTFTELSRAKMSTSQTLYIA